MDIQARVDAAISKHTGSNADLTPDTVEIAMLMLVIDMLGLVLEYQRETLREMRQSFTAIARMENTIMIDETAIKQHVQDSADALAAIADGVQKMRDQLAVGNDTAVQSELDKIDALLSPVATRARALADSFNAAAPAPAPTPAPVTDPTTDPTSDPTTDPNAPSV